MVVGFLEGCDFFFSELGMGGNDAFDGDGFALPEAAVDGGAVGSVAWREEKLGMIMI